MDTEKKWKDSTSFDIGDSVRIKNVHLYKRKTLLQLAENLVNLERDIDERIELIFKSILSLNDINSEMLIVDCISNGSSCQYVYVRHNGTILDFTHNELQKLSNE